MPSDERAKLLEETRAALERVQNFDAQSIVRERELGTRFAFRAAVEPAQRVISLFQALPGSHLDYFPEQQLEQIKAQSNAFFSLLDQFLKFEIDTAQPNPTDAQTALNDKLEKQYQGTFNVLFPFISFATARSQDFSSLEREARAAVQASKDAADAALSDLEDQKKSAATILDEVRAVAAEQGVSKQAIHFKTEADTHQTAAEKWRAYTIYTAIGLAAYAIASLFFHKVPGLAPTDAYRAVQLSISKILIFGVIAYMLFLCARNFMSHRHNEIVNRHRQNALATFTALAEATSDAASSDIVLSHAAACIFSPQDTGYIKHDSTHSDGVPSLQVVPRIGHTVS